MQVMRIKEMITKDDVSTNSPNFCHKIYVEIIEENMHIDTGAERANSIFALDMSPCLVVKVVCFSVP